MSDLQSDLFVSTPIIEQKRISVTADWWDDIHAEMAKISKLNSDYKHQIHTLRQRCESLVREAEALLAEKDPHDARSRVQRLQHAYDTMLEERDRLRDEAVKTRQTKPQERTEDGTTRTWDALPTFDWKVVADPIRRWDAQRT